MTGDCYNAIGHITINGHQHSINNRGINTVLFDYRSGIYEHRNSYDTWGSSAARSSLATFLNSLASQKILFMAVKDAVTFDSSSAQALQRYGVSATFATTSLPKSQCSMAAIAYTGKERKEWEMSVNKVGGGERASIIEKTIHIFRELDGSDDCSQEMGIQTKKIPDSAFTATTTYRDDAGHSPYRARLHENAYPGWCSEVQRPVSDYLQVDIGTVKILTGLAIQGHGSYHGYHYVTKFKLDYSIDGSTWNSYKDIGISTTKEFHGIRRLEVIETRVNWFYRTMVRYLKFIPSERVTPNELTCLRIELYGCTPKSPIFVHDGGINAQLQSLALYSNSLTVYYTVPAESKSTIEISTAADNKTLESNIDQLEIQSTTGSILYDNGTLELNVGTGKMIKNQLSKIDSQAVIEFKPREPNYFTFNVNYRYRVRYMYC